MKSRLHYLAFMPLCVVLLAVCTGCDDDRPSHKPPDGQGAIYISNNTASDMNVFINGEQQDRVRAYKSKAFDREPGVYRLVLDQRRGDRTFRDDVDVLEGRLTVVDVISDPFDSSEYDVAIFFRTP